MTHFSADRLAHNSSDVYTREFKRRGFKSPQGFPDWSAAQVRRALLRAEETHAGSASPAADQEKGDAQSSQENGQNAGSTAHAPPAPSAEALASPICITLWINDVRGLYSEPRIKELLAAGTITRDDFFWRPGMPARRPIAEFVDGKEGVQAAPK